MTTMSDAKRKNAARKAGKTKGASKTNGKGQAELPHTQSAKEKGKPKSGDNTAILPGEGMPRRHRRRLSETPKAEPVTAKRGKLYIGGILLEYSQSIEVGRDGGIYLIDKLTVERAKQLLKRVARGQRGVRDTHVRAIAQDMTKKRYVWTGEPIRVDSRGYLIDGQHRLGAAVRSGTILHNVVLCVVKKKANIANIDEGVRRNIRDRRSILGKSLLEYSVVASVAYEASQPDWALHTRRGMSNEEVDSLIDACPVADEMNQLYAIAKRTYGRVDSALIAVCIRCLGVPGAKKDARLFFGAVVENSHSINGRESKQVKALCNHLMHMSVEYREGRAKDDTRKRRTQTTHKTIEAWNAWRKQKQLPSPWRYSKGTIPKAI